MTVVERIREDWKQARLSADKARAGSLGTLVGELQTAEKKLNPARPLRDDEALAVVRKFAAGAEETARILSDKGRDAQAAEAREEAALFAGYLPSMMTDAEVEEFARAAIAGGAANMGAVMKALQAERAGRYDGKSASAIVRGLFA